MTTAAPKASRKQAVLAVVAVILLGAGGYLVYSNMFGDHGAPPVPPSTISTGSGPPAAPAEGTQKAQQPANPYYDKTPLPPLPQGQSGPTRVAPGSK
jgi:hypothetical protein